MLPLRGCTYRTWAFDLEVEAGCVIAVVGAASGDVTTGPPRRIDLMAGESWRFSYG